MLSVFYLWGINTGKQLNADITTPKTFLYSSLFKLSKIILVSKLLYYEAHGTTIVLKGRNLPNSLSGEVSMRATSCILSTSQRAVNDGLQGYSPPRLPGKCQLVPWSMNSVLGQRHLTEFRHNVHNGRGSYSSPA